MVVFYDKIGNPVDAKEERFTDVIPGGLAKRIATHVDDSVHSLSIRVEIRVLDFRIAE
jgi:hypothetical protein